MARRSAKGATSAKAARRKARKRKSTIQARKKKEYTFQGLTVPELQELSLADLLPLLPARARRSFQRGLNEEQQRFVDRLKSGKKEVLKTHRRNVLILPNMIGKKVAVYNGKEYIEFEIQPEMVGHYLGEFSPTRKSVRHSGPGVGATRSSKFMPMK